MSAVQVMTTTLMLSRIVVVIPTKDRPTKLARAISSVYAQSILPHLLIVVGEKDSDLEAVRRDGDPSGGKKVPQAFLVNRRARNLSGSVNTAFTHLLEQDFEPQLTYVSLLDDDDEWEPKYLQKCIELASNQNLDWVIAGITRHEAEDGEGINLSIPKLLKASQFLITNPHVQGSNLFVRFATLLKAGCFDENLRSTTDRDLCIRLLNLGDTRVGLVREHLVHHMASGLDRLSTPGSEAKRNGLIAFYQKYNLAMLAQERDGFVHRATTVFHCTASDFQSTTSGSN